MFNVALLWVTNYHDCCCRPKPKPRSGKPASSTRSREVVSPLEYQSVEEWLTSIKMERYTNNFLEAGHDSINSCLELTADDLTKYVAATSCNDKLMQGFPIPLAKIAIGLIFKHLATNLYKKYTATLTLTSMVNVQSITNFLLKLVTLAIV